MSPPTIPPPTIPIPITAAPTQSSAPTITPTFSAHVNVTNETNDDETALWVLSIVSVFLAIVTTYFLVRFFARKDTPTYVRIIVGVSWFLGFFGILTLLPLDLVTELYQGDFSPIATCWMLTYWATFLLAWVICAIAQEYHLDGNFTFRTRLWSSIVRTVKFYLKVLIVLVIIGVILYFAVGLTQQYLVAASNFYGLFLIVIMLGYGLVELPISIWRAANAKRMLESEFFRASTVETAMIDAEDHVDETVEEIVLFRNRLSRGGERDLTLEARTDQVLELAPRRDANTRTTSSSSRGVSAVATSDNQDKLPLTMYSLATLHMNLKIALTSAERARWEWNHLLTKTVQLEKLIEFQADPDNRVVPEEDEAEGMSNGVESQQQQQQQQQGMEMSTSSSGGNGLQRGDTDESNNPAGNGNDMSADPTMINGIFSGNVLSDGGATRVKAAQPCAACCLSMVRAYRNFVFRHHTIAYRTVAIGCAVASIILLWSAVCSPFSATLSVYGMTLHVADSPPTIWAASFIPLVYMVSTCYMALFKFNYFDVLALHGNQQTDAYNLLYNASYMTRLEFSLGVVYFNMLFPQDARQTAFYNMVGDMDTKQFIGVSFNKWAPILILVFAIASFFNLGNRVLDMLGIGTHKLPRAGNPEHEERIAEGKRLVLETRARRDRERRRQFAVATTTQYAARSQLSRATGREGSYARVEDLLDRL